MNNARTFSGGCSTAVACETPPAAFIPVFDEMLRTLSLLESAKYQLVRMENTVMNAAKEAYCGDNKSLDTPNNLERLAAVLCKTAEDITVRLDFLNGRLGAAAG